MTESGYQPVGVAVVEPKAVKLIYKLTPASPVMEGGRVWGCSGCAWGLFFSVSLEEYLENRERAA